MSEHDLNWKDSRTFRFNFDASAPEFNSRVQAALDDICAIYAFPVKGWDRWMMGDLFADHPESIFIAPENEQQRSNLSASFILQLFVT